MRVAVIIPAFNEEARISPVLAAATKAALVHEVLVVCDGSTDRTAEVSRQFSKVDVVELPFNVGKGGAMAAGVRATQADVICFVDADLIGLRPEHIDKIILPILSGKCGMCVGIFRGGKFWSDTAQRISPYISGQRAMERSFFESIPFMGELRMGVEVTLNTFAKRQKLKIMRVVLHGVSNTHKEMKMGLVKGASARAKMYAEIGRAMVRFRRKRSRSARLRR